MTIKKLILIIALISCVVLGCKKEANNKSDVRQNVRIEAKGDAFNYTIRYLKGDENRVLFTGDTYSGTTFNGNTNIGGTSIPYAAKEVQSTAKSFIQVNFTSYSYNGVITPVNVKVVYKGAVIYEKTGTTVGEAVYIPD